MRCVPWSAEEEAVLVREYAEHGAAWDGWADLLPGRTRNAICCRARRLDVSTRDARVSVPPDPNEGHVLSCMRYGMTPSQIDRREKWWPGTAKRILKSRWERMDA